MGAGKYLAIFAALLTILGTYVFAMYSLSSGYTASAIGVMQGLDVTFDSIGSYSAALGGTWVAYILIIIMIIFSISGFIQFIGIKSRAGIFIFSLFPLVIGILITLTLYETIDIIHVNYMMTIPNDEQLIADVFPYLLELNNLGLGTYFVLGGGFLGIISAILPRENTY